MFMSFQTSSHLFFFLDFQNVRLQLNCAATLSFYAAETRG